MPSSWSRFPSAFQIRAPYLTGVQSNTPSCTVKWLSTSYTKLSGQHSCVLTTGLSAGVATRTLMPHASTRSTNHGLNRQRSSFPEPHPMHWHPGAPG